MSGIGARSALCPRSFVAPRAIEAARNWQQMVLIDFAKQTRLGRPNSVHSLPNVAGADALARRYEPLSINLARVD